MSNIFRTNFEEIKEVYKGIFEALERASEKFDINYYLIGAQIKRCLDKSLAFREKNNKRY